MKKPIDLKAQLEALREQEALLKERHRQQLTDLLERTGADLLEPELLAGLLLDAVERTTGANGHDDTLERWRAQGEAFFRKGSKRARAGAAEPAVAAPASPPPAAGHG